MSEVVWQSGEVITSRQNAFVKDVCALSEKKYRERNGKFRFDGLKLCEEAIRAGVEIETAVICESAKGRVRKWLSDRLGEAALEAIRSVRVVSDGVFEKISEEKSPDGIICIAKALDKLHKITTINNIPEILPDGARAIFLSELRDPGNVGTILRAAAAFGVEYVLLSKDSADLYQSRTLRAAMGAIFRIHTLRIDGDSADACRVLAQTDRRVFATALDARAMALGSFDIKPTEGTKCHSAGIECSWFLRYQTDRLLRDRKRRPWIVRGCDRGINRYGVYPHV